MSGPEPIKPTVEKILERLCRKQIGPVGSAWRKAVDGGAREHSRPVSLEAGRLTVLVDSPVYLQHLLLNRNVILARVRETPGGGAVKDIKFKMGSMD